MSTTAPAAAATSSSAALGGEWPPGPAKEVAKSLDLFDIGTFEKLHEEYGDVFIVHLGKVPLVVLRNPADIKRVLVELGDTHEFPRPPNVIANVQTLFGRALIGLDGDDHMKARINLNPHFFAPAALDYIQNASNPVVAHLIDTIEEDMGPKGVEMYFMTELMAFDLVGVNHLGHKFDAVRKRAYPVELKALKLVDRIFLGRAMDKNWKKNESETTTMAFDVGAGVLVNRFQDAIDGAKGENSGRGKDHAALLWKGQKFTETEMVNQLTGLMAGVGNSARAYTDCTAMLADYPECQKKILYELHRVIGGLDHEAATAAVERGEGINTGDTTDGSAFPLETLMKLEYVQCFLSESLRCLSPSTSTAPRYCPKDSSVGGYKIPAGTKILVNLWGGHYHASAFEDPFRFDPERFNSARGEHLAKMVPVPDTWMPFGFGGHRCMGQLMFRNMLIGYIAMLVGRYDISWNKEQVRGLQKGCSSWASKVSTIPWTTKLSEQLLGFVEPLHGAHVDIRRRPVAAAGAASGKPMANASAVSGLIAQATATPASQHGSGGLTVGGGCPFASRL